MTRTLALKVCQGLQEQGCDVYGRGSIASAMKPLEAYVQKVIQREVLAERKRCANVCDDIERKKREAIRDGKWESFSPKDCAAAIRRMK